MSILTILALVALTRKREVKYMGGYTVQKNFDEWDMQRALEDSLDNPQFIKKLIGKLNEYQLNRSGEIKGEKECP